MMIELLPVVIRGVFSLHIFLVIILFLKRFISIPDPLAFNRVGERKNESYFSY